MIYLLIRILRREDRYAPDRIRSLDSFDLAFSFAPALAVIASLRSTGVQPTAGLSIEDHGIIIVTGDYT